MKLDEIKSILNPSQKELLERVTSKKIFTEKQVVRILVQGFRLSRRNTEFINERNFNKFSILIESMYRLNLLEDRSQLNSLTNRLLSRSSFQEAVNEMYCHLCLTHEFENYLTFPLFSDAPDGKLVYGEKEVHIEIKSRFPQFIQSLYELFSNIHAHIEALVNDNVHINIEISGLSKLDVKGSRVICKRVTGFCNSFLKNKNRRTNIVGNFTLECDRVHLNIEFRIKKRNFIELEAGTQDFFWLCSTQTVLGHDSVGQPKFSGQLTTQFMLDEYSRSYLAGLIVKECIKRVKNLPREPNMIVIYTELFRNDYLAKEMQSVFDEYTKRHTLTCVLGCFTYYDENIVSNVPFFSKGNSVKLLDEWHSHKKIEPIIAKTFH